jgi:hypothetical protein
MNHNMHTKPLPPYGKELQTFLMKGNIPKNDIFLSMGINAWHWAKVFKQHQWVLVLPYDQDPFAFSWPVKSLSILAFDTARLRPLSPQVLTRDSIRRTAYALLAAESRTLRVMSNDGSLVVYRRGTT